MMVASRSRNRKLGTLRLADVAEAFDQIEATRSRLAMAGLIAELLRRASANERAPLVYFLQGRLGPAFEPIEIGLGEAMLVRALASAGDTTETAIRRRLRSAGDLGQVAESLAISGRRRALTVGEAHAELTSIAGTTGSGSVERRLARFVALLRRLTGREAKLLVRVAQGRLRLGLGDQVILEAAALGALGDRRKKELLERAYNVRSDLGSVVALAFARGQRALALLGPGVGVPIRPALAQRLPSAHAIIRRLGTVQVEPKYDGFRLQLHRDGRRVSIFSRRLEDVSGMFPELVAGLRNQLKARRAIIEGEAIAHNPETGEFLPFQVTMTRKRKTRIAEASARYPLRLFAFDLLLAGRTNYLPATQRERSDRLQRLLPSGADSAIAVTESIVTSNERTLQNYFDEMIARGLEGVVAKRLDAPYQAGARGYDWVKLKRASQSGLRDTVDVVLVGYQRGRGKRASLGIGSLLAAVYDPRRDRFRTVAKIGSGLSDAAWRELRTRLDHDARRGKPTRVDSLITADVWVEPRYVVEVLADEITRSPSHTCGKSGNGPGYALRFPRVLHGIRADKTPSDATTEREILDMFRHQRAPHGRRRRRAPAPRHA